jgi:agmatinase
MQAHLATYPEMGVLHIDAHADLRAAYEGFAWSHASIMRNLIERTEISRLVQVGLRDVTPSEAQLISEAHGRIVALYDGDLAEAVLAGAPFSTVVARAIDALPRDVYVSFDIDGLDPSLCPNTGTPVPGGLSFHQACALLAGITRSGRRLVGFDLVEVAPGPDGEWDGNVGARILYKLCGHALLGK